MRRGLVLAAAAALLLSGCGGGSGASEAPDASDEPSATASAPASSASGDCGVKDANFCVTFDKGADELPEDNTDRYFVGHDDYDGGSYRMVKRAEGFLAVPVPVSTTEYAADFGARIDVDVTVGKDVPAADSAGLICFAGENDAGSQTGFVVAAGASTVELLLRGEAGDVVELGSANSTAFAPGKRAHLTLTCQQDVAEDGSGTAVIKVEVDGEEVLTARQGNSVKDVGWQPTDQVKLMANGDGADYFFDNLAVTGACVSSICQ